MMEGPIAIRADGSSTIGTGHLMRCFTLALQLKARGAQPVFCAKIIDPLLKAKIDHERFSFETVVMTDNMEEDARMFCAIAKTRGCQAAILDGYDFVGGYTSMVKRAIPFVVSIDDTAHAIYASDMIINQNVGARPSMYDGKISGRARLCLGPAYAMLRDEFLPFRKARRSFDKFNSILIAFGGADPHDQVLKSLRALEHVPHEFEVTVVLGSSNPRAGEVDDHVKKSPRKITVYQHVDFMAELIARADLVLSSGGTTTWEICFLGAPSLQMVFAENQTGILEELHRVGAVESLGWHDQHSEEDLSRAVRRLIENPRTREDMSRKARSVVDGNGARRAAESIMNHDLLCVKK